MESIIFKPTRTNLILVGLAAALILLAACRQTDAPPTAVPTAVATAASPTPISTTPPPEPTPEPTPIPLPTAWPTAVYNPDLPDWTILVHTTADRQTDWQAAPITGSVQLLVSTGTNLAAFWADGRQTAPANRYALILQQSAAPPELVEALPPIDLIIFDQPQTIRLELLNEWQPYGRIALGSPAFAAGWAAPERFARLTAEQSSAEAIDWARWLITDYQHQEEESELAAWRPLTAVNLHQLHEINRQLSNLSQTLSPLLAPIAPPLTMRIGGHDQYDLESWAAVTGQTALLTAVNEAIIQGGPGLQFAFTPLGPVAPPLVSVRAGYDLPLDAGQPAYLLLEWAGVGLADLEMQTGRIEEDGRLRLIHRETVPPQNGLWRDGVHQFPWLWRPLTPYLSDGETAAHLPFWTLAGGRLAAVGQYLPASGATADGWLILNPNAPDLAPEIWALPDNPADWQIILPAEGDRFVAADWYLTEDGLWAAEMGATFLLLPEEGLALSDAPLPPGDYLHRFVGSNLAGATAVSEVSWEMTAPPRWPNQVIYLEKAAGFQLAYPQNWRPLELVDGRWQGGSPGQTTQFAITRLTDWPGGTVNSLQRNALAAFGEVEQLLAEPTLVDGRAGLLTAYGYSDAAGPRTGLLLAFVNSGVGYLVDIDGPFSAETENLALARQTAASWSFIPPLDQIAGLWQRLATADFAAYYPTSYQHQPLNNGWHLLREPDAPIFVALRQDEAGERGADEAARHWLAVAGRDVENFAAKEAEQFAVGGRLWTRIDFSYAQSGGRTIYGLIMTTMVDGREWSVWAEAPPADFARLSESIFLFTIASMESR